MKKFLRIVLPVIFIVVAAVYFNSAVFSAWVSGGPPNEYPKAWAYRSFRHLFYGIGFVIFAITVHLSLKSDVKRQNVKCIIGLLIGMSIFATPHIAKFLDIDSCLDQGGRWDEAHHRCIK
jgi:hypothetical protein